MDVKELLNNAKKSEKRWIENTIKINQQNKADLFNFDTIESTHSSIPELILKTTFNKTDVAYLCTKARAQTKEINIILCSNEELLKKLIDLSTFTTRTPVSFENHFDETSESISWDTLKTELVENKVIVNIIDIRSFKPVGKFTPKRKKITNKKTKKPK